MPQTRAILHVDMDAFFASVEQRDDPRLRGKPVLVGHDGARGVVTAASYEARTFGCHSAQPMAVAKRQCPQAIVVSGRHGKYAEASRAVFAIFDQYSPLVQPLSIDEAFLDVTGTLGLFGLPAEIAADIKRRIKAEVDLTASVGVAPNKFLAKLASDWEKPDGLTVIEAEGIPERLAPLPIRKMWGVGPAAEQRLLRFGIHTFGDLQRLSEEQAAHLLGGSGAHLRRLALGEDFRSVTPDGQARSIGNERTFGTDLAEPEEVRQVLLGQCEHVGFRLRKHDLLARAVTVKIRFGHFETITRSRTLDAATDRTDLLWAAAAALFDAWSSATFRPVRLVGFTAGRLQGRGGTQMPLFGEDEEDRGRSLDATTDAITVRFGRGSIRRGIPYTDGRS